jgi:hypothetical protein
VALYAPNSAVIGVVCRRIKAYWATARLPLAVAILRHPPAERSCRRGGRQRCATSFDRRSWKAVLPALHASTPAAERIFALYFGPFYKLALTGLFMVSI